MKMLNNVFEIHARTQAEAQDALKLFNNSEFLPYMKTVHHENEYEWIITAMRVFDYKIDKNS